MDFYQTLGVSKTVTDAELKAAYRKKALEWHPDRNKAAGATEKFKEINEAYEVLSNPQKRQTYDQVGPDAFNQNQGYQQQQGPFSYTYRSGGGQQNPFEGMSSQGGSAWGGDFGGFSDPFEIFEQFFGAGYGGFRGGSHQHRGHYQLTISFMEAVKGAEKTVNIGGNTRTIKIPPGVDTGSRVRFPEFDLTVEVAKDKIFERQGDDIFVTVKIPVSDAVLGGVIDAPTLDGTIKLRVPSGTQPGSMIRLRGQGVPHVNGRGAGSEYVKIEIEVPTRPTSEQKKLYEQLQKSSESKKTGWF
ncbi:MAG: DnaJ C-terminal domain-containing protein [Patescibacteria group bacterium]